MKNRNDIASENAPDAGDPAGSKSGGSRSGSGKPRGGTGKAGSGRFVLLVTVTGMLGLALLGWYYAQGIALTDVRATGNSFTDEQDIASVVDGVLGEKADSVSFMPLIEQVETLPYVKQAHINVRPSGRMDVRVEERQPLALLLEGDRRYYVDREGIRLPFRKDRTMELPLLYTPEADMGADTLQSKAFKALSEFLVELRRDEVSDLTVSEVGFSDREGVVALSQEHSVRLVFGEGDFERRLRKWREFYTRVAAEKGMDRLERVDLRFNGQIVTNEQ